MGPTKGGLHRPENVGQQLDIFWPVRASLWRVATFKSLLGAARHSVASMGLSYAVLELPVPLVGRPPQ